MRGHRLLPFAVALTCLSSGVGAAPSHDEGRVHGFACDACHRPAAGDAEAIRVAWVHAGRPVGATTREASDSLTCLGCHDGTVSGDHARSISAGGAPRLGRDPLAEHPVGVSWSSSSPHAVPVRTPPRGLPLFGADQRVECATCHDVHDGSGPHLLRASTAGSDLCLRCH